MSERFDNHIDEQEIPKNDSEEINTINNLSQEEIIVIYNFLVNDDENSTWINNAVKYYANQKELNDYQRVLLAPANAFENFVKFVGSVFSEEGRSEIYSGVKNINELPETLKNLWFVFYNKLNRTQKLAVGVQLGTESVFIGKAIEKLCNIVKIIRKIKLMGLKEAGYIY